MRGALTASTPEFEVHRIIPADAGSTMIFTTLTGYTADHPRGCGEHLVRRSNKRAADGSSPRMRGAPPHPPRTAPRSRIIPADAGSTRVQVPDVSAAGDHPRGCGEHDRRVARRRILRGSSPRMRGARLPVVEDLRPFRIIPADAGSTSRRS